MRTPTDFWLKKQRTNTVEPGPKLVSFEDKAGVAYGQPFRRLFRKFFAGVTSGMVDLTAVKQDKGRVLGEFVIVVWANASFQEGVQAVLEY
jgi:hypothetical protein